ncbi:MAG: amidohydrolase family protein, partial [Bacteroidota bacterium]
MAKRTFELCYFCPQPNHTTLKHFLFVSCLMLSAAFAVGQESTFPSKGVQDKHHVAYAFVNATVHPDHRTTIENGSLLIRDGKVVAVGAEVGVPNGAILVDLKGKHIYPSLIDMYADYGVPQAKANKGGATRRSRSTAKATDRGALNWNPALHPEVQAVTEFTVDAKAAIAWRKVGFGVVASHRHNGIMRGTGLVALLGEGRTHDNLLVAENAVYHSFKRGVSPMRYPGSLMGAIALLRQTYLDADWYAAQPAKTEYNRSLEAVNRHRTLPHIFEVRDYQSALRADRLGDEFGIQYLIKGKGDEYLRLADIKATGAAYILPLTFPKPYEVADPFDALHVSLGQMKHWEMAPGNAFFLDTAGVPFAFTTRGLKDRGTLFKAVRKAISYGLPDSVALKALTIQPARLLRIADQVGSLEPGKLANFLITSCPLFAADNKIYENWVCGKRFVLQDKDALDIRGDYDLNINGQLYQLAVTGSPAKPSGKLNAEGDTIKHPAHIAYKDRLVSVSVRIGGDSASGLTRLSGKVNYHSGVWDGQARLPDGQWGPWTAIRKKTADSKKKPTAADSATYGAVSFPNGAYGFDTLPKAEDLLIINATVWTNTDQGILRKTSVHLRNGKIQAIGQNLVVDGNPEILDAKGRHLTPGIIDEHSHIAISRGVNEGGQAVSAEVRIGDVITLGPYDLEVVSDAVMRPELTDDDDMVGTQPIEL